MRHHDCPRFRAYGIFYLFRFEIVGRYIDVHKYRNASVEECRIYRCWKSCRNRYYFIPRLQPFLTQHRRCKRREGYEVSRRTRIDENRNFRTEILREFALELLCIPACGE